MSYTSPTHYALSFTDAPIHAAKVFFKLIGPTSPLASNHKAITTQYPAFGTAEAVFYPMEVCRSLAAILKESNAAYPPGRRGMTHLDVGWLQRA